jgi:hypothetical protein
MRHTRALIDGFIWTKYEVGLGLHRRAEKLALVAKPSAYRRLMYAQALGLRPNRAACDVT